ncbi:M20 aminoacylase family protein [Mameliella alba]|uniref:M20 aminoacylase family protein n=1 Tax=Mameliella alba TaxID=561184 RepID=UPI000B537FA7|nr:M20 aminoacylase family protein [Mameliella alba]MBY6119993.1 amidohydrolase [Mameliella alba]OWV45914.1 amidohydrolase [Mameliella alba]OWV64497.1 amidohydrolase [Mameliella alba]
MPVKNRIADWQEDLTEWRRHLHAHPELRFEEHETARFVAEKLRGFGCDEVIEGVGQTGVVAVIRGRQGGSGRTIAFRADMDALPILEQTGADHASTIPGKMHACGHDGHTTMLLGACRYLAETRNFDGTVVALFQPAEEGSGGAKAMIGDGVFDRYEVDEVYAMHNWPGLTPGHFATRPGPFLASADKFEIRVTGKGGHGAMPHLAVDTNLAAAQIVTALHSIPSRDINAQNAVVISVCGMKSETFTYNVLPDAVTLIGTVRQYDVTDRETIRTRIRQIAEATALAHGAQVEMAYIEGVDPLVNAEAQADLAADAGEAVSGHVNREAPRVMGSEDFGDMLRVRPGAFVFIGNGDSADLHNPGYDFDDSIAPVGASWFATLAETRMPLA